LFRREWRQQLAGARPARRRSGRDDLGRGQYGNPLHAQDHQVIRRNTYRLGGPPSAMPSKFMILAELLPAAFLVN
jgi:hypothetical protein